MIGSFILGHICGRSPYKLSHSGTAWEENSGVRSHLSSGPRHLRDRTTEPNDIADTTEA